MKIRRFKRPDRPANPWALQYRAPDGSRPTKSFATKSERDREAEKLSAAFAQNGASLAEVDLDEWRAWCDIKRRLNGVPVATAVDYYLVNNVCALATFSEARDRYLRDQENRGLSADHLRHLVSALKTLESIAPDPLSVSADTLQAWFNRSDFGPETKINYRKYFRAFYNYCQERGILGGTNVGKSIKLPRIVRGEPKILTLKQVEALFAEAWKRDPGVTARMALEAFAGVRASAAGRISYGDLNFKERGITLRARPNSKTSQRHYIDGLPDMVWKYLDAVTEEEFELSESQYMHRKSEAVAGSLVPVPKNALRHSFVTYLCAWKKSADLAAYIVGHRKASGILFDHYRGIANEADGQKYFELPGPPSGKMGA